MRREALVLIALGMHACAGPGVERETFRVGALAAFESEVEPHLEARCASAGCHGRDERPLRLYARGEHRIDPARRWLDEPLDATELEANALAVAGFAQGPTVEDALVLRKPLAQRAGGCWHGGGDVFADTSDVAYRALADWIASAVPLEGGSR